MVNEVTKVATPSGGLYPAEWLAAEAERLEREHDAIEHAKDRLLAHTKMLLDKHDALKTEKANHVRMARLAMDRAHADVDPVEKAALQTEMVSHVRAAQQLDIHIQELKKRGHPEVDAPCAEIRARRTALIDARVNLALSRKAHNSDPRHQINMIADRIARLLDEADAIKEDVKDIFAEAKGAGFEVGALKKAVAVKRVDTRRSRRGASG